MHICVQEKRALILCSSICSVCFNFSMYCTENCALSALICILSHSISFQDHQNISYQDNLDNSTVWLLTSSTFATVTSGAILTQRHGYEKVEMHILVKHVWVCRKLGIFLSTKFQICNFHVQIFSDTCGSSESFMTT